MNFWLRICDVTPISRTHFELKQGASGVVARQEEKAKKKGNLTGSRCCSL